MSDPSDELVYRMLGKIGDAKPPGDIADRWGQLLQLGRPPLPHQKTFIATRVYEKPLIWAIAMRFSVDGFNFTQAVPAAYAGSVNITITKGIDEQSMPATENLSLAAGQAQTFCTVIAKSLFVVASVAEPPDPIWVEIVATPVHSMDCADILGPIAAAPVGFTNVVRFQFDADGVARTLAASKARRLFIVQNRATTDLSITFGNVVATGILLPGGISAIYESNPALPYYGELTLQHTAVDATGFVTMVQSIQPFVPGLP